MNFRHPILWLSLAYIVASIAFGLAVINFLPHLGEIAAAIQLSYETARKEQSK